MTAATAGPARPQAAHVAHARQAVRATARRPETQGALALLTVAHPALCHRRAPWGNEWSLRVSAPLAAEGIALEGSLTVDTPLRDDTCEALDAFLDGDAAARAEADAMVAEEAQELAARLASSLAYLHRVVLRGLGDRGIDRRAYLAAVSRKLSKAVELHPEDARPDYRPSQHLREVCWTAARPERSRGGRPAPAHAAPKTASKAAPKAAPKAASVAVSKAAPKADEARGPRQGRPGASRRQDRRRDVPAGRPFRMRRWSAIYPD